MNAQFKKGILELCILHQLKNNEMYGYEIMQTIQNQFNDVYNGSIYAILRRLNAEKHTKTQVKPSLNGPDRKYYSITSKGLIYLSKKTDEWQETIKKAEELGVPRF